MHCSVQNIITFLSVRIKGNHISFSRTGQVFFGLLFLLAFGLKVEGQTATIARIENIRSLGK